MVTWGAFQSGFRKTFWRRRLRRVAWMGYDFTAQDVAGDNRRLGAAGVMKPFGYLHDGLFGGSLAVYALNRLVLQPYLAGAFHSHLPWAWPFLHSHLDDLLLMPAALPVVLWVQWHLGLRPQAQPPGWREMFSHLVIWSVMCKIVGPLYCHIGVADPWDVLFFAAGGSIACLWWNCPVKQPGPVSA